MSESSLGAAPAGATPCRLLRHAPAVSRAGAALSRSIGRGVRLALPDPAVECLLLPAAGAVRPCEEGRWLRLETAAGPLWLEDGARMLAALSGLDGVDEGSAQAWPPWLAAAVAGRLQGTPLATLIAVRPVPAPDEAEGVPQLLRLRDGGHALCGTAVAAPQVWLAMLAEADGRTQALSMPLRDWLPLVLGWPVPLAEHRLPVDLVRELAAGDLILPSTPYFDTAGRGRLTLAGSRWRVRHAGPGHLHILNEESDVMGDSMDDEMLDTGLGGPMDPDGPAARTDTEEDGKDGVDGDSLPRVPGSLELPLRFELGRLHVSLDRLRSLGPGVVLELRGGSPHEIAIVCGGGQVGRGEAVDVEGRLGVRITHWGLAC